MGIHVGPIHIGKHGPKVDGVDIEGLARDAIEKAAKPILDQIAQQGKDRLYDITYNGNNYLGAIKSAGEEIKGAIPGEVEKYLEEGLKNALGLFFDVLASGFLKKYIALLDTVTPDSVWPAIGPVAFEIADVREKLDTLKKYANHPPHDAGGMKQMVIDLAPESVWVTLMVNVPGTDSLKAGGQLVWKRDTFVARIEDIVKHL